MKDSRSATLSEIVADALRQALYDGVYIPGERLAEMTIAHEMNVSQNTARDALRLLEQEGWVIKRARHGVYVRDFTPEETEELFILRAALEGLALDWALANITLAFIDELHRLIAAAREHAEINNAAGVRESLFAFHTLLAKIANRPQTAELLKRIHNQIRLLENLRQVHAPRDRKQWRALAVSYVVLVDKIESGDPIAAHITLKDIILREGKQLLSILDLI